MDAKQTSPVASVPDLIEHLRAWVFAKFCVKDPCVRQLEAFKEVSDELIRLERLYAESFASVGRNLEAERSNP